MSLQSTGVRWLNAPILFWGLLALPGAYWTQAFVREKIFYGEILHLSGDFAVQLLIATLTLTPLRLLFPRTKLVRWLVQRRRYIGVAAFGYGLLHTAIYLQRKAELALILDEAKDVDMWTGWLALLVMLLLAITSNDLSVRKLRRRWQTLHRTVYVAAALIFAHWILTAFDPFDAYLHATVLIIFLAIRLVKKKNGRSLLN